jgi:hypothetical protein
MQFNRRAHRARGETPLIFLVVAAERAWCRPEEADTASELEDLRREVRELKEEIRQLRGRA